MTSYGFSTCGYTVSNVGTTQRFDDTANTHTLRANALSRRYPAGYSFNNYGFSTCGQTNISNVGTTQRFDDTANTHTGRADATARYYLAGYSFNNYGFSTCGYIDISSSIVGTTQRFDDTANTHTGRTSATARYGLAGYSFNNYGFTSCGSTGSIVGTTQRFDDTANTHTGRTNATARYDTAGYSFNNYGFTSCGAIVGVVGTTQRFDDTANTHTGRADATARYRLTGYSFNNYGFTSCGNTGGTTQRFDDTVNTHTGRADAIARISLAGYAIISVGAITLSSTPIGAEIWFAPTGSPLVDQGVTTMATIVGLTPGIQYTYELRLIDYYPKDGIFTLVDGETITRSEVLDLKPCPESLRYSENTITLQATPRDGIGPYYVEFRKNGVMISSSRLDGSNPILNAPENTTITRHYILNDADIVTASMGTISFEVFMYDSCPTGANICGQICTINIGCVAPICNFSVT